MYKLLSMNYGANTNLDTWTDLYLWTDYPKCVSLSLRFGAGDHETRNSAIDDKPRDAFVQYV